MTLVASAQNAPRIDLVPWATGLDTATDIACAGPADPRLFITLKQGIIRIVTDSMTVSPRPFLDLSDRVNNSGGEQGLLGLAFDPNYAENGSFYLNYITGSGPGVSVISRWHVSSDPDSADVMSESILYTVLQPYANHNGGDLAFGPDSLLYITFGDGGSAGDPEGHAQDLTDPLGDILRIAPQEDGGYIIPATNPYATAQGDTVREIYASGLRNPFRFGFDSGTGDLWIGDVGQSAWEELDFIPASSEGGQNFGWRCYEGPAPYDTEGCMGEGEYDAPVAVHMNDGEGGAWCSIIGGRVYRGSQYPHLYGHYIYTDHCMGEFWSLTNVEGMWVDQLVNDDGLYSGWNAIGEDNMGELYVVNGEPGQLFKIVDRCPMDPPVLTYTDGVLTASAGAVEYAWFMDNAIIAGATSATYTPEMDGSYYVMATFANGCMLRSEAVELMNTGVTDNFAVPDITLAPNPANDLVQVRSSRTGATAMWTISDAQGRIVRTIRSAGGRTTAMDVSSLAAGQYVLQARSAEGAVLTARVLHVQH